MSSELTLANIKSYLGTSCNNAINADTFLLEKIKNGGLANEANDNFLELYNEQYARNMEAFVGILIVSAILAKMIFYPTKL
jgi:hypothetical protein